MEKNQKNYVYILRCADGTYYTGFTTDPDRRRKRREIHEITITG